MKQNVLFLETQGQVLRTLQSTLGTVQKGWQSVLVTTTDAAVEVLSQRRFGLIAVSFGDDLSQCQDFYSALRGSHPELVRLLLIDPQHKENSTTALFAQQSIAANCTAMEIRSAIESGLSVSRRIHGRPRLASLLSDLDSIPSLPKAYFQVRDELDSPAGSSKSIARIVEQDPALAARMLKVANSGLYAQPRTITDLERAVTLLGPQMVLGILISAHLYDNLPVAGLNLDLLWNHGSVISVMARHIAETQGGDPASVIASGVAGLLHDLGTLVFLANLPEQYMSIFRQAGGNETVLVNLEEQIFGVNHAELGAIILQLWALPDTVIDAVGGHHGPAYDGSLPARAVRLAEWLINEYTLRAGDYPQDDEFESQPPAAKDSIKELWASCESLMASSIT